MGDIIQLLPEHVANQIAAGEVVQRPASVVKELLENAVDAKATNIQLIVKDAGRTLIQVVDNGIGMSVTDLRMAFERHATSKIRTTEDIFQIATNGFRGEALASICAVAQVEATTKRDLDEIGHTLGIEGSKVRNQEPVTAKTGTSISIKNLFFNVPARRNFLKSNNVEFRHIQDEFIRVALANPELTFQLIHNGGNVYQLKKANLKQRIIQLFGRKLESALVPVTEETEVVNLSGFVGTPEVAKKSRGEQFFFVNHRFIRNGYMHKAIVDAFDGLLPKTHQPTYFLYLDIPPEKIDINIHPTKTEIKFEHDHEIYAVLRSAVKHALGQFNIAPTLDFEQLTDWEIPTISNRTESIKTPEIKVNPNYNPFESNRPSSTQIKATSDFYREHQIEVEQETEELFEQNTLTEIANCFQWKNQYLVYEYNGDLLLIDQHRAHQKILYEDLISKTNKNVLSQQLLFPIEINLNEQEKSKVKQIEKQLIDFGFDLSFQEELVSIQSIPTEVKAEQIQPMFSDFLSELEYKDEIVIEDQLAKLMAKSLAVKKGEVLQQEQIQHLAQQLLTTTEPNLSPFGKRIYVRLQTEDIFKKLS